MGSIIDLHIHTIVGSMDSDISPKRLAESAKAAGLTGVALTEHMSQWLPDEVEKFREESGLFVFNAREWSTDMGHIIVLGLDREVRGLARVRDLRRACEENGAYMILCHPFRYYPGPSNFLFGDRRDADGLAPEVLAEHPLFHLVDAIEVLNGGCIERENELAQEVAQVLGRPGVAGSDAHMPMEVGRYGTVFEKELESEQDMLAELRAGRFQAARRLEPGVFEPLEQPVRP
ncbi:MAG: PHP domain-containing protein [Chloroflexi bacterium]|nr:PHP domain-containing protein [Chloroflexota bacterium]